MDNELYGLTYQQLVPEVTRLIVQLVRGHPVVDRVDGTACVTARCDPIEPIVVAVGKLGAG